MSRGGSFDRLGAGLEFCDEWKRRRACALSNNDLNPVAEGIHRRQPSCLESNLVPTVGRRSSMFFLK